MVKDYIRYKMTGEAYAEYSDSAGGNLENLATKAYDRELLALLALRTALTSRRLSGIYSDYPTVIARTVKITKTVYPNPDRREIYERKYRVYRKVIDSLAGVWSCFEN